MTKGVPHRSNVFCAISFNVHDSSVSFAIEEKIILVLEAERVFRVKKKVCSKIEMDYLISYGLSYLQMQSEDVEYWAMTTLQNPYLTTDDIFEPTLITPKEPYWKEIEMLGSYRKVLIVNHHLSHAATYLLSGFSDAVIATCDGGGDYNERLNYGECVAGFYGDGISIKRISNIDQGNAVTAKFYGACSFFIYKQMQQEGKMMALASYGISSQEVYYKLKSKLPLLGTLAYTESVEIIKSIFPEIYDRKVVSSDKEITTFAASAQKLFSDCRIKDIAQILNTIKGKRENLVMAGGASLNLDTNSEILKCFPKLNHFIAPCCDDTGQSLGAICILITEVLKKHPSARLPYLGMEEGNIEYNTNAINSVLSILLKDGVVILHNGKSEVGPRALGNRSFITRPDKSEVKEKLSERIKQRENYRPVAPVVLQDRVQDYFIGPDTSPYMLYKYDVKDTAKEKIAGAVHCDGSARVQTISRNDNKFLYDLITAFGDQTGAYVLLNTSLNLKGDPISNTIEDSLDIYSKIEAPKCLVFNGDVIKINNGIE